MAPSASLPFFLCLILLMMAGAPPAVHGTIACMPFVAALAPCLSSLSSQAPTELCCAGVTAVSLQAKTALGKVLVCHCLKDLMRHIPQVTPEKACSIARQCNVEFEPPAANATCFNMTWPSSP